MSEEKKENDVAAVAGSSLPAVHRSVAPVSLASGFPDLRTVDIEAVVKNAEKYMQIQKRLREAALQLTNTNDWVNQDGNPYLEISGTNKVAAGFGISYRDIGESRPNLRASRSVVGRSLPFLPMTV